MNEVKSGSKPGLGMSLNNLRAEIEKLRNIVRRGTLEVEPTLGSAMVGQPVPRAISLVENYINEVDAMTEIVSECRKELPL